MHATPDQCNCGNNVFQCTNELSKLRADAAKFFTAFQTEHNIAHQDLQAIQSAVNGLGSSLSLFARVNYGADFPLDTVQCIVKNFIDIESVERLKTNKRITHLEDECDKLVNMVNDFKFRHNLVCKRTANSGCEADLNQLRCELSQFFKEVNKAADRAVVVDLWGIELASGDLGHVERRFKSKYQLVCASDPQPDPQHHSIIKSDTTNLRNDLKYFHGQAQRPYDDGNARLKDLTDICNTLTAAIETWVNKLK